MIMIWSQPAARASSTPYWMMGLSTNGSISLGCALVAGRKRVPRPAAGNTALRTFIFISEILSTALLDAGILALGGLAEPSGACRGTSPARGYDKVTGVDKVPAAT